MSLPKNESAFDFSHVGELTGKKYEGTFSVKCMLSIADKRILEIEKSRLTADLQNPTGNLSALGSVVANLRVRVINAPDWFNQSILSLDILDEEVIFELYSECLNKSEEWRSAVKDKAEKKMAEEAGIGAEGNAPKESKASSPQ